MKRWRIMLGAAAVVLAVIGVMIWIAEPAEDHPFFSADTPNDILVIAHQGGDGERPGNTMSAFTHAAEIGVDVLEMDVHTTADGVIVVIHDDTIDRTTNGSGRVQELTFEEIQSYDAGYNWPTLAEESDRTDRPYRDQGVTIPALEEVLSTFPDYRMVIEIKQKEPSMVVPFCDLLRDYEMEERVIIASFHPETINEVREACPEFATSAVQPEVTRFFVLNTLRMSQAYSPAEVAFQVPEYSGPLHVVTPRFTRNAQRRNIAVQVWTVNSDEQMETIIAAEVNGIITDYPTRLQEKLNR